MGRIPYSQSTIISARDQLFLDTAEGRFLDAISLAQGLRHVGAIADDHWRAMVKAVAWPAKAERDVFRRILEICIGPRFSRCGELAAAAAQGDRTIDLRDASDLVQVGRIRLDPGLATEETVAFYYRDLTSSRVFLDKPIAHPHLARTPASARLRADAAAGATSLLIDDSTLLPTSGFPYPFLVGKGTELEETVGLLTNDTGTDTVTVTPTANAHAGPTSRFWKRDLTADAPAGRTFLSFGIGATRDLPATGWTRLNTNQGNEEVVYYWLNDATSGVLYLAAPLTQAHGAHEPVERVDPGARVDIATVVQDGRHWQIFEFAPDTVTIYVPKDLRRLTPRDAAYLHGDVPNAFATTLVGGKVAGPTQIDDVILKVVSATGFPAGSALVVMQDGRFVCYIERELAPALLHLAEQIGAVYPVGTTVTLYVDDAYPGTHIKDGNIRDDFGALVPHHWPGPYIYDPGEMMPGSIASTLAGELPFPDALAAAQPVGRTCVEIADASLWTGAPFDIRIGRGTGFQEDRSVQAVTLRGITTTVSGAHGSTLTHVTAASSAAFPVSSQPGYSAGYRIRIGGVSGVALRVSQNAANVFALETPIGVALAGGETIELLADVMRLSTPTSKSHVAGARVDRLWSWIDVVDGSQFSDVGGTLWLNFGWGVPTERRQVSGVSGVTVTLRTPREQRTAVRTASLVGDQSLDVYAAHWWPHGGDAVYPIRFDLVIDPGGANEEVVTVTANLPEALSVDLVAPMVIAHAQDEVVRRVLGGFPTTGYPYQVQLSDGLGRQQNALVDAFDPVADTLILASAPSGVLPGDGVLFRAGEPEAVEYVSREVDRLLLAAPTVLTSGHRALEAVMLSAGEADPDPLSFDYQFHFPPDPGACMRPMFDIAAAAGVRVETTDRP